MGKVREPGTGPRQVYVHLPTWKEFISLCKERGISSSRRLREIIHDDVNRMKGTGVLQPVNYEELMQRQEALDDDVLRLEKKLEKRLVYDKLVALARNHKLDTENYANLLEVMPKILTDWPGYQTEAHLFCTLLEALKKKREIEAQLRKVRTNG